MPGAQDKRRSQLTTEQRDLRKAELLRRRKIQLKQKSERERQEVIDRLLNKQPSKKSDATETATAAADEGVNEMEIEPTPAVASIRFTSSREGNFVFVSSDAIHLLNQLNQPPMSPQSAAVPKCSVQGCTVAPKYKLKDGVSRACSLDHYKLISV
ncbi:hypothetical protein GQ42DRAFT_126634 [Ramicandelaber brevisporus]|nr:hypothetical protein GQ42DRAFT_126634 [Ramicandelaber brevisporus]